MAAGYYACFVGANSAEPYLIVKGYWSYKQSHLLVGKINELGAKTLLVERVVEVPPAFVGTSYEKIIEINKLWGKEREFPYFDLTT